MDALTEANKNIVSHNGFKVGDKVFLSNKPNGGTGVGGVIDRFEMRYHTPYVFIVSNNGKTYRGPAENLQKA